MSYSASAQGKKEEVVAALHERFAVAYPNASEKTSSAFEIGVTMVDTFLASVEDDGRFSASISGHANQGDEDSVRDSITVYIAPVVNSY